MPGDPLSRPLIEIARELRDRRTSARELVEVAIARHERFGERLHAYSFWAPIRPAPSPRRLTPHSLPGCRWGRSRDCRSRSRTCSPLPDIPASPGRAGACGRSPGSETRCQPAGRLGCARVRQRHGGLGAHPGLHDRQCGLEGHHRALVHRRRRAAILYVRHAGAAGAQRLRLGLRFCRARSCRYRPARVDRASRHTRLGRNSHRRRRSVPVARLRSGNCRNSAGCR